jgi:regulatory protein YycI of two-component signal transduction system YycFG
MKIKNIIIVVSVLLNVVLGFLFYNETTKEGPIDVGISFKEAVRVENYELAKTLMAESRQKHISEETLNKVNEVMSAGTSFKTYIILEFDNREMVLLNLTPDTKYEIQDIVIVPDELKSIFK